MKFGNIRDQERGVSRSSKPPKTTKLSQQALTGWDERRLGNKSVRSFFKDIRNNPTDLMVISTLDHPEIKFMINPIELLQDPSEDGSVLLKGHGGGHHGDDVDVDPLFKTITLSKGKEREARTFLQ